MSVATASPSKSLRLSSHVRACCCDGQVILLDLRRNKYLGIGGAQSEALAGQVAGWPGGSEARDLRVSAEAISAIARQLLLQGLLTHAAHDVLPDSTVVEAVSSLDTEHQARHSVIGVRRLARVLQSAALAALWLRFRSLDSIARIVAARRERLDEASDGSGMGPPVFGAAAAYEQLRPFVFTAQERCLHDSLTLVDFLASERLCAQWVIGVKARPFAAHSWVQNGSTVLNDQHERVRRFSPILVV